MSETKKQAVVKKKSPAAYEWHLLDAKKHVLGRLASDVAKMLLGKHHLTTARNKLSRIKVIVINTDHIHLSGNKETDKYYYRYSGYPSGLHKRSVATQRQRDSRVIVRQAVLGMLPKNKLRNLRISNLHLYRGAEHPHSPQIAQASPNNT